MAMEDSVTVSMGEEMSGVFRVILRVRADVKSYDNTWPLQKTSEGDKLSM